jgi:hypothetical protein
MISKYTFVIRSTKPHLDRMTISFFATTMKKAEKQLLFYRAELAMTSYAFKEKMQTQNKPNKPR